METYCYITRIIIAEKYEVSSIFIIYLYDEVFYLRINSYIICLFSMSCIKKIGDCIGTSIEFIRFLGYKNFLIYFSKISYIQQSNY